MDAKLEIGFIKDKQARELTLRLLDDLAGELADNGDEKRAKAFIPTIIGEIKSGKKTDAQIYERLKVLINFTADSSQTIKEDMVKPMLGAFEHAIHMQTHAILLHNLQRLTDLAQDLLAGGVADVPFGGGVRSAAYHTRHDIYTLGSAARTKIPGAFVYERLTQLQNLVSKGSTDLIAIAKQMLDVYEVLSGDSNYDKDRVALLGKMKVLIQDAVFGLGGSAERPTGGLMSLANRVDQTTAPLELLKNYATIVDQKSLALQELAATDRKDIKEMKRLRGMVQRELESLDHRPNYYHKMATNNEGKRTAVRFLERIAFDCQVDTGTQENVEHYLGVLREAVRLVCITSEEVSATREQFSRVWDQLNDAVSLKQQNKDQVLADHDVKDLGALQDQVGHLAQGQSSRFGLRELVLYKLMQYDHHLESGGHLESTSGYHYRGMAEGNEGKRLAARDMFFAVISGASDQTILSAMARFLRHSAIDKAVHFDGKKGSEGEKQFAGFYIQSCSHYVSQTLGQDDTMKFRTGKRQETDGVAFDWLTCDFAQVEKFANYSDKGWLLQTVLFSVLMANPKPLTSSNSNCVLDGHTKKELVRGVMTVKGVPDGKQVKVALLNFASAVIYGKADFETLKAVVMEVMSAATTNKGGVPREYREIVSAITAIGQGIQHINHRAKSADLGVMDDRPLSQFEESMQQAKSVIEDREDTGVFSLMRSVHLERGDESLDLLAEVDRTSPSSLFAKVNKAWLGFNKEKEQEVVSEESNSDEAEVEEAPKKRSSILLSRRSQTTEERPRSGSIKEKLRRGSEAFKKRVAKVGVRKVLSDECWLQLNNVRLIAEHGSEQELYFALAELMAQTGRELQRFYPEFHAALDDVYQQAALQVGAVTPQRTLASQHGILGRLGGADHGDESSSDEQVDSLTTPTFLAAPPSLNTDFPLPVLKASKIVVEEERDEEEEASVDSYNGGDEAPPPPPRDSSEEDEGAENGATNITSITLG